MGSVYAFSSELDAWVRSRKVRLEQEQEQGTDQEQNERTEALPGESPADVQVGRPRLSLQGRSALILGSVALLALLAAAYFVIP